MIANPPRDDKVMIEGPWIDDPRSEPRQNFEADAAMIRGLVGQLKKRCWQWFDYGVFNTRELSPAERQMFDAVKITVDGGRQDIDELNQIATILETQGR